MSKNIDNFFHDDDEPSTLEKFMQALAENMIAKFLTPEAIEAQTFDYITQEMGEKYAHYIKSHTFSECDIEHTAKTNFQSKLKENVSLNKTEFEELIKHFESIVNKFIGETSEVQDDFLNKNKSDKIIEYPSLLMAVDLTLTLIHVLHVLRKEQQ